MTTKVDARTDIEEMCSNLATNPLFVQGAGGNVSWKENDTLWVKASGTWLSDAIKEDIFIPTDLVDIRQSLANDKFDESPKVLNGSSLKPSIETVLHALMPQRIVVHLHAIDILSQLVKVDFETSLKRNLLKNINYALVPYCKPGADLAKNVYLSTRASKEINVVFLLNHGIVLGGDTSEEIMKLLDSLVSIFKIEVNNKKFEYPFNEISSISNSFSKIGYKPAENKKFHSLILDKGLSLMIKNKWALFPDHVVFLGEKALIGNHDELLAKLENINDNEPPFIFCKDIGVFQHSSATIAQIDQLQCFYDVAIRQSDISKITTLSNEDIGKLLDWDAEKYRLSITK